MMTMMITLMINGDDDDDIKGLVRGIILCLRTPAVVQGVAGNCMVCRGHRFGVCVCVFVFVFVFGACLVHVWWGLSWGLQLGLGLAGAGEAQLGSEGIFEAICFLKLEGDNWNQMFAALCVKYS